MERVKASVPGTAMSKGNKIHLFFKEGKQFFHDLVDQSFISKLIRANKSDQIHFAKSPPDPVTCRCTHWNKSVTTWWLTYEKTRSVCLKPTQPPPSKLRGFSQRESVSGLVSIPEDHVIPDPLVSSEWRPALPPCLQRNRRTWSKVSLGNPERQCRAQFFFQTATGPSSLSFEEWGYLFSLSFFPTFKSCFGLWRHVRQDYSVTIKLLAILTRAQKSAKLSQIKVKVDKKLNLFIASICPLPPPKKGDKDSAHISSLAAICRGLAWPCCSRNRERSTFLTFCCTYVSGPRKGRCQLFGQSQCKYRRPLSL